MSNVIYVQTLLVSESMPKCHTTSDTHDKLLSQYLGVSKTASLSTWQHFVKHKSRRCTWHVRSSRRKRWAASVLGWRRTSNDCSILACQASIPSGSLQRCRTGCSRRHSSDCVCPAQWEDTPQRHCTDRRRYYSSADCNIHTRMSSPNLLQSHVHGVSNRSAAMIFRRHFDHSCNCSDTFRRHLKTHYFQQAFSSE